VGVSRLHFMEDLWPDITILGWMGCEL